MHQDDLLQTYQDLLSKHGNPSKLWPQWCAKEKGEELRQLVALGAILTQRTSWRNADLALRNLKNQNLLSLHALSQISDPSILQPHTHPAGFHQTKPRRLVEFSKFVVNTYGTLSKMKNADPHTLHSQLLDTYGIGPETADTILLYALDLPSFVVAAYTRRWLEKKHNKIHSSSYGDIKEMFEYSLPKDVEIFQNFHILIIVDQKGMDGSKMELV